MLLLCSLNKVMAPLFELLYLHVYINYAYMKDDLIDFCSLLQSCVEGGAGSTVNGLALGGDDLNSTTRFRKVHMLLFTATTCFI